MSKIISLNSPFRECLTVKITVNGSFEFVAEWIDNEVGYWDKSSSATISKEDAMKLCDWIISNVT